jgi:hypothetical protein
LPRGRVTARTSLRGSTNYASFLGEFSKHLYHDCRDRFGLADQHQGFFDTSRQCLGDFPIACSEGGIVL